MMTTTMAVVAVAAAAAATLAALVVVVIITVAALSTLFSFAILVDEDMSLTLSCLLLPPLSCLCLL